MRSDFVDLTGQRFEQYVVLEQVIFEVNPLRKIWWRCRCDCGVERIYESGRLRSARAPKSCKACSAKRLHGGVKEPDKPKAIAARSPRSPALFAEHLSDYGKR